MAPLSRGRLDDFVTHDIITVMPKRVDAEAEQARIAHAAVEVIADVGLAQTRLRDVARAAGVTTGAVTHYFDNKEAVLEAALEEVVARTLKRMQGAEALGAAQDLDVFADRVCSFLPLGEQELSEWRVWLAYWGRAVHDERLRHVHAGYYEGFIKGLIPGLRALPRAGKRPSLAAARRCADSMVAALDGVGVRATLQPELWPSRRQRQTLKGTLLPLLGAFVAAHGAPGGEGE